MSLTRVGMSDEPGSARIYKPREGGGSSSLHRRIEVGGDVGAWEEIALTTVDAYRRERGIAAIHLLDF